MDPISLMALGVGGMFALIALHVPIGVAMGIAGVVGYGLLSGFGPAVSLFDTEPTEILTNLDLAVIPLFLLMGSLAGVSGLSADIYRLAYAVVGHRRGGLALATLGGCAGFGAVCGSSPATAATMGRVALPEMLARGYAPSLASGCVAAGGTLGMLVPPSIVMVIYAFLAEQFVITLFIAALVPAVIAVAFHCVAVFVFVRLYPDSAPAGAKSDWSERLAAARQGWGVVVLLAAVIGGIYGGIFTVTEAAGVGVGVTLVFAIGRGRINRETFGRILTETATNTAMIYVIIFGASIFTLFIVATRAPDALVTAIGHMGLPPLAIIGLLLLMYLMLGSVFETVSSMLITMPFVQPLVLSLGYDPIWWGVLLVMVIEIGMITPPIGINVFIIHGVARTIPLPTIFSGIVPFLIADLARLAVIAVFPVLALWLPGLIG